MDLLNELSMSFILTLICPCVGILYLILLSKPSQLLVKKTALFFSILTFYISLFL